MLKRTGSLFFLVILFSASSVLARWEKVLSTRDSLWIGRTLEIRSGHFFDERVGMVGAGSSTDVPLIFLTNDGGSSWQLAITPMNGNGVVSSFFFRDRNNGYATVHKSSFPSSSIWRTSDGGFTWVDMTGSRTAFEHTCIYETSKAIIVTSWDRTGGKGGFSTDGGASWNEVFANAADHASNGIDFADDLHGVVTMGPASLQPNGNNAYLTSDGGLTWRKGQEFNEAWSVYAIKGTSTFFLAPEGDISGASGDRNILRSDDYGQSFQIVHQFPTGIQLVGHIDGHAKTLYVQTRRQSTIQGLFRSDDLGVTWKNVGGPSNIEDSRFVVTGCVGEVVYAFDHSGNIWKTTDGGDSTLSSPTPSLKLSADTLLFSTLNCSPIELGFIMTNASCDSLYVDSLSIEGDSAAEFSITTARPFTLGTIYDKLISVTFAPRSSGSREVVLRIKGRRGLVDIDTTITIQASNRPVPELFIPQLTSVGAGTEISIPIYIRPTTDTFSIPQYRIHLRYNGDIVSPNRLTTMGTLSESGNITFTQDGNNAMLIAGTLDLPVTQSSDLSKPLIEIVMSTYLSSSLSTVIEIDSFGTPIIVPRCPDVALPQSLFAIGPDCGHTILSDFMRTNSLAHIRSVRPNPPSRSGKLEMLLDVYDQCTFSIELLDVTGNIVTRLTPFSQYDHGVHSEVCSIQELPSGAYYLRLRSHIGAVYSLYPISIPR